ncbi:hypothetical protein [Agrobacterium tumefaciens]|uniref:hypothetical protein n=1 Tax=Agrobacterium tumefaciens TaxID=358 RepID=UPI001572861C|nr:hypothetical protein [Agrobacterium tumefaciens]
MKNEEVVSRIEKLNGGLASFWAVSTGWAPIEAAGLLTKARLDWQVSLSSTLRLWLRDPETALSDGELILAWSNLGSLVEGTLKLLLSVFYMDYKDDVDTLKKVNAFDHKKQKALSPDGLTLQPLKLFAKEHNLIGDEGNALVDLVQQRRNTIHAFKDKPLGDDAEFQMAVTGYLLLLKGVNERLPYPDDIYAPREI